MHWHIEFAICASDQTGKILIIRWKIVNTRLYSKSISEEAVDSSGRIGQKSLKRAYSIYIALDANAQATQAQGEFGGVDEISAKRSERDLLSFGSVLLNYRFALRLTA